MPRQGSDIGNTGARMNASDASAGRSKDKGFQKRRAKQKEEEKKVAESFEFYGAGRTSPDITGNDLGTTHRDHADKKADAFMGGGNSF